MNLAGQGYQPAVSLVTATAGLALQLALGNADLQAVMQCRCASEADAGKDHRGHP